MHQLSDGSNFALTFSHVLCVALDTNILPDPHQNVKILVFINVIFFRIGFSLAFKFGCVTQYSLFSLKFAKLCHLVMWFNTFSEVLKFC